MEGPGSKQTVEYTHDAVGDVAGIWSVEQGGFNFSDIGSEIGSFF